MPLAPDRRSRFVQALGAVSVAVGVLDATKPRTLARSIGIGSPTAFQLAAVRELICGAAMIASPSSRWPIAVRLAGDVADIVGIAAVARRQPEHRAAALRMGGAVAMLTVLDVVAVSFSGQTKRNAPTVRSPAIAGKVLP